MNMHKMRQKTATEVWPAVGKLEADYYFDELERRVCGAVFRGVVYAGAVLVLCLGVILQGVGW
jgi:hypothetical protein